MKSAHLGEFDIPFEGRNLTIAYTMAAQARLAAEFGDTSSLQKLLSGSDAAALAKLLAIGLHKHHPDITEDVLLDSVVPLQPLKAAISQALIYAFFGPDGAPKAAKPKKEAGENPPDPKAT